MLSLLMLLGLVAVFFAFVRTFTRPIRSGAGGALAEFIAWAIVIPFRLAWAVLRALGAIWVHSRRRRVKLHNGHPIADRLARAGQQAANRRAGRTMREPPLPHDQAEDDKPADDDPGFDQWFRDNFGD